MAWQRLPLAFELQSPLHIGFLPNQPGTVVARTRCYVPGKNLWGAVVANLTPRLYSNLNSRTFMEVGTALRSSIRFSYFYLSTTEEILTPDYAQDGLIWGILPDREFRSRYIAAYVSTSIDVAGGAKHGTLHEIEFLRDRTSLAQGRTAQVLLAGVVWIDEGAMVGERRLELGDGTVMAEGHDLFDGLTLGGERNYGFGLVRRVPTPESLNTEIRKLWPQAGPDEARPVDHMTLLGHLPYSPDFLFKGDVEVVAGREYPDDGDIPAFRRAGARVEIDKNYWFVPGTRLEPTGESSISSVFLDSWGRLAWSN